MFRTIRVSSCVSVQGEFVEDLSDGRVVIRVGETEFLGQPVAGLPASRRFPEIVPKLEASLR